MHVSIGHAARLLGVSVCTLRRWEREGFLLPSFRTAGQHRRYLLETLERHFLSDAMPEAEGRVALAYSRVSSSDQLSDLETQKKKLASFCEKKFAHFELVSDLGSGLNYKKPRLNRLMSRIFRREVSHLVLNHMDRLLRFGSEIIFSLCKHFGVEVIILKEPMQSSFEQELASDVIELMTVFSSKLYGRRSYQNRKKLAV